MNNTSKALDLLLQRAETVAQKNIHLSRQTRQAVTRQLERHDSETVARQLDEIYQYRVSRLPTPWRVAQLRIISNQTLW